MRIGRGRLFYGWIVVGAGMTVIGTAIGLVHNTFGLFIVPICRELGFSREAMGYTQTVFSGAMIPAALFAGPIFTKLNMRRLMVLSSIVLCLFYFLFSTARSLMAFCALAAVVAFSTALVSYMPFSIILRNWFHDRLGLAVGLTFMGSGLGGMLFNLLGGLMIAQIGWRATIQWFALILAAVQLPCLLFLVRIRPEDIGLQPLGRRADVPAGAPADGMSLKQAVRTPRFALLTAFLLFTGMAVNAVAVTATPHYTGVLNATSAAAIASGFMACLALGKFALGFLFDRLGVRRAVGIAIGLLAVALTALYEGASRPFIALFLASCGIACAFGSVPMGLLAERNFGARDYGAITGIFSAASSFGGMLAPPICGRIFDVAGSYAPAYGIFAVLMAAIALPMALATRPEAKLSNSAKHLHG